MLYPNITLEGADLLRLSEEPANAPKVYVVLTDTNTGFSKLSKKITKQPYNHVSMALDEDLEKMYTFALKTDDNGYRGGFKLENQEILRGSRYSLYSITVTRQIHRKIQNTLKAYEEKRLETRYRHTSLINAVLGREVFSSTDTMAGICSEFLLGVLEDADVHLFKNRHRSTLKPYDMVRSRLMKHVRRGTF